jgi:hypothetical protein
MTNEKCEQLARLCDSLAVGAATPGQRDALIELAGRWRAMSTDQGGSQPALGAAHRAAVRAWLWAMPETPKPRV